MSPAVETPNEIKIPMKAEAWEGKAEFVEYKGFSAMNVVTVGDTEQVILRNIMFQNGTIAYGTEMPKVDILLRGKPDRLIHFQKLLYLTVVKFHKINNHYH